MTDADTIREALGRGRHLLCPEDAELFFRALAATARLDAARADAERRAEEAEADRMLATERAATDRAARERAEVHLAAADREWYAKVRAADAERDEARDRLAHVEEAADALRQSMVTDGAALERSSGTLDVTVSVAAVERLDAALLDAPAPPLSEAVRVLAGAALRASVARFTLIEALDTIDPGHASVGGLRHVLGRLDECKAALTHPAVLAARGGAPTEAPSPRGATSHEPDSHRR